MGWHKSASGSDDGSVNWKPEGEGEIVGKLIAKKTVNLPENKGGPTVLLKVETSTGQVNNVWCSRGGLKTLAEEYDQQLIVGREVGFRTSGPIKTESGNTFFPYEIWLGGSEAPASSAATVDYGEEPF